MFTFRENFNTLISEKDKELEALRNEVRDLSNDSDFTKPVSASIHDCVLITVVVGVVAV